MNKPVVLVDQDGPLVDWEGSMYDELVKIDPALAQKVLETKDVRDFFHLQDVCETYEERETFWKVGNREGFYRHLKPIEGAFQALAHMVDLGIEVFICTTPTPYNATCHSDKVASLMMMAEHAGHDPIFWGNRVILTRDKTLVRGHVLVDDKPEITGVRKPEWTHVPFHYSYNAHLPGPRIRSWSDDWQNTILPLLENN